MNQLCYYQIKEKNLIQYLVVLMNNFKILIMLRYYDIKMNWIVFYMLPCQHYLEH